MSCYTGISYDKPVCSDSRAKPCSLKKTNSLDQVDYWRKPCFSGVPRLSGGLVFKSRKRYPKMASSDCVKCTYKSSLSKRSTEARCKAKSVRSEVNPRSNRSKDLIESESTMDSSCGSRERTSSIGTLLKQFDERRAVHNSILGFQKTISARSQYPLFLCIGISAGIFLLTMPFILALVILLVAFIPLGCVGAILMSLKGFRERLLFVFRKVSSTMYLYITNEENSHLHNKICEELDQKYNSGISSPRLIPQSELIFGSLILIMSPVLYLISIPILFAFPWIFGLFLPLFLMIPWCMLLALPFLTFIAFLCSIPILSMLPWGDYFHNTYQLVKQWKDKHIN